MKRFTSAAVLSFVALLAPALALAAVDINTANESQLEALPGIGPKKAKEIVAERQANGPYKSVDDLRRVRGIGEKTIADLRAQASAGSPPVLGVPGASRDSAEPAGRFSWGWVVVVVAAAGGIGWFMLRRRLVGSSGPATAAQQPSASAPVAPKQAPAVVPTQPAPAPKPAGPGPAAASAAKPATTVASTPPPAPAGPKPAGQPAARSAGAGGPPPAPAGPKRKDG